MLASGVADIHPLLLACHQSAGGNILCATTYRNHSSNGMPSVRKAAIAWLMGRNEGMAAGLPEMSKGDERRSEPQT